MTASNAHDISADFKWQDEYQTTLEAIADTDEVESDLDWLPLKDAIKYKIIEALASFPEAPPAILHPAAVLIPILGSSYFTSDDMSAASLANRFTAEGTADAHRVSSADQQGFFPSKRQPTTNGSWGKQLKQQELERERDLVFGMLDEFDTQPPFTIQRLAELTVRPQTHQKTKAKYLSALQRVLSVTATRDVFPISPTGTDAIVPEANGLPTDAEIPPLNGAGATVRPRTASVSQPPSLVQRHSEPLFSPIPFLIKEAPQVEAEALTEIPEMELGADRTQGEVSPSIPPAKEDQESPADADTSDATRPSVSAPLPEPLGIPYGRVDEVDGSDSIHPLSSTTTAPEEEGPKPKRQRSESTDRMDEA